MSLKLALKTPIKNKWDEALRNQGIVCRHVTKEGRRELKKIVWYGRRMPQPQSRLERRKLNVKETGESEKQKCTSDGDSRKTERETVKNLGTFEKNGMR